MTRKEIIAKFQEFEEYKTDIQNQITELNSIITSLTENNEVLNTEILDLKANATQ